MIEIALAKENMLIEVNHVCFAILTDFRLKCVIIITSKSEFFFEIYAIVAMEGDNVIFYACKIIKVTSGFNLKKTNFFARWRQHPQNS